MSPAAGKEVDAAPLVAAEQAPAYTSEDLRAILNYTRNWIQYGLVGFTVTCILIGAVESLFGR